MTHSNETDLHRHVKPLTADAFMPLPSIAETGTELG